MTNAVEEETKTALTPEETLKALLVMKQDIEYLSSAISTLSLVINEYCKQYPLSDPGGAPVKPDTQLHGHGLYL